jgi:branched-chain amino acid transport system ATP-binding protein
MLLALQGITVHYEKVEVLRNISMRIDEGEIVTLIGANGAGKTTTLRVISGLKRLTSGEIWYEGKNIGQMSPEKIVELGIAHVPEGRRVFTNMTVYENLVLGAFSRKDKNEIEKDLEERYRQFPRLKERKKQQAGSLSGGEQQMLAIARALMARPKLMLLDEPTMGLAPLVVSLVADIIREINQNRVSVLLVEQNARVALRLAEKGYVMETGSIVVQGASKAIKENEHVKQAYLGGG